MENENMTTCYLKTSFYFTPDFILYGLIEEVATEEGLPLSEAVGTLISYGYDVFADKVQVKADLERQLEPLIVAIQGLENKLDDLRNKVGNIVDELE